MRVGADFAAGPPQGEMQGADAMTPPRGAATRRSGGAWGL